MRFVLAACLRAVLIAYGEWQDANLQVKYTDVDYNVFTDAASHMSVGSSPYQRPTYRYSPLLALILLPNIFIHHSFGKILFSICDLIIGWLLERILTFRGVPVSLCHLCCATWLFNPLTATVSSRGNAESLLGVLVLLAFVLVMEKCLVGAGIVFALAIHFKLYPVIYSLPLYLLLDSNYGGREAVRPVILSILPNRSRWIFTLTVVATLFAVTAVFYKWYGIDFLQETYFYHFTRKDTRHNFSPYFYMFYLMSAQDADMSHVLSQVVPSLAFVPQLVLLFVTSVLLYRDITLCCFVQTFVFVSYNKVCTSQYFLWYIWLLPLILPYSRLQVRWTGASMISLWFVSQGVWLLAAYLFEFQGLNSFIFIWIAGLFMLASNSLILYVILKYHDYSPTFQFGRICHYTCTV